MIEAEVWHVRDGELVGERPDSWVYVWRLSAPPASPADVLYIGTTGMPPALRMWHQLHSEDEGWGRVRHRFPAIETEPVDIYAFRVPEKFNRPEVKHALVQAFSAAGRLAPEYVGPPVEDVLHPGEEVQHYAREVLQQLDAADSSPPAGRP